MAVTVDGSLWQWGLIDDTWVFDDKSTCPAYVHETTPQKVTTIKDVIDVTMGEKVTLVLKNDGTLWSWGRDVSGLLGGGGGERTAPTQILDQVDDLATLAQNAHHILVRRRDGTLWGWGDNTYGQIALKAPGITYDRRRSPTQLPSPPRTIRLRPPTGGPDTP